MNKPLSPVYSSNFQDSLITLVENVPVALAGDLQRTTVWELMIGREQNDVEREKIIKNIASQDPGALILLGDMVSNGSDLNEWIYLKNLLEPVVKENIPIIPVLGNHEYWGNDSVALYNAGKVFPVFQKSHWFTVRYGNIVFIILDSNRDNMSEDKWSEQRAWFENKLKFYDSDSSVKGTIVCLHHPPYTNSIVTGDNINVQEAFVQPFINSEKTMAMITGHAHTYERFHKKGKMFIVSGGGGGPRVLLKTGPNVNKDLVNLPSPRPFNYLLLYSKPDGIKIVAKGLKKGSSNFFTIDDFSIPFNNLNY
ncbi:MAG: metallophosphoesterase [Ignavibacteriaceae bacterium]